MTTPDQQARANAFRDLNRAGELLLPNAWDAASARIFETAGFPAIGTTSAGIAYARGFGDAERIGRDAMVREIATIASAVAVPVTADIEAGRMQSTAPAHRRCLTSTSRWRGSPPRETPPHVPPCP